MFRGQVRCLLVVSSLATHSDGGLQVKLQLTRSLDERVQFACIFQLGIAVQEKRGMVDRRASMVMQFFQILDQVMDPLRIQILFRISMIPNGHGSHKPCE